MEFSIKSGSPQKQRTGCVVVGIFDNRKLTAAAQAIDTASRKYISEILRRGDHEGKAGTTLLLPKVPHIAADRVLLVGLGREREFGEAAYRGSIAAAMRALKSTGATDISFCLTELPLKRRDVEWRIEQAVMLIVEGGYRFDRMKSKPPEAKKVLKKITLHVGSRNLRSRRARPLRRAGRGDRRRACPSRRTWATFPATSARRPISPKQAIELGKTAGLKVTILDKKEIEKLGMGSFLAVAQGSVQPPKLIVMEYHGAKRDAPPVALVGKGVTFDTGGISIKPSAEMDEMKFDMCGAASVLGTMKAIAAMKLPINVVGAIPATENMPGGNAIKPGDIVTTMSGQTVEILNTDAEGRLILCDALTYVEKFKPAAVIDIATLTGAMVIALGHVATGMFSNSDPLAREIIAAGDSAWDRAWHMPLWDDYQEMLKSNFADFPNIGTRAGGSVTAACFLARFTKAYPWAHLDIAGTAWKSGSEKGATGRPVALLVQFLARRAAA